MQRFEQDGLVFYRFAGLKNGTIVQHAIFTRLGGASRPPFAELNLGGTVGDDPETVRENHHRVYATLGVTAQDVVTGWLVHGRDVRVVNRSDAGQVVKRVDGLITRTPGLMLFLRFADCLPVLLYDPVQSAVGIVHAGWRGTVAGVTPATVQAMQRAFGSRPTDLWAGVGPGIGPCCYEVGDDVIDAVNGSFRAPAALLPRMNGSTHFDVPGANVQQLEALGVRQIEQTPICTGCQVHEFFSHRAERGKTGRFGVAIGIKA
jgi:hypothetical protein